jgi:hypothetical protein
MGRSQLPIGRGYMDVSDLQGTGQRTVTYKDNNIEEG